MPVASVSSDMPGLRRASALASSIALTVKPPRLAYCSKRLSLTASRRARWRPPRRSRPKRTAFRSVAARGRRLHPRSRVGAVGDFEHIADEGECRCRRRRAPRSSFSCSSASDLIFLSPGLISSTRSCSRIASARARGGTLASVRSTARSACLRSNAASALALSALVTILMRSRELLFFSTAASLVGETRLLAVGVADGEHQRLGIPQPEPAAPDDDHRRQEQCQQRRNSNTCRRLVLPTCERAAFPHPALGLQHSWPHPRDPKDILAMPAAERPARS